MESQQKLNKVLPYIIGIAGGSASGKSRLLRQLATLFQDQVTILSFDDFYKPELEQILDENGFPNFDLPASVDLQAFLSCLHSLEKGTNVQIKEYHFNNPNQTAETYKELIAKPIIMVEGLFVFYFSEVLSKLNLSVYIHADKEIRYARRIARDTEERGATSEMIHYQWHNHVQPAFDVYLQPFMNKADIVVNNNLGFDIALNTLHQSLLKII